MSKILLKVRTVFLVSVEALLWKIITFIWKWMSFMKCILEKRTCVTLKWEDIVCDMSKTYKTKNSVPLLCRSFILIDNNVLWKRKNFMKWFCKKSTCYSEMRSLSLRFGNYLTILRTVFTSLQKLYFDR